MLIGLIGKNATADINVPRSLVHNGQNVTILVLDINGNWSEKIFRNIQLPEPVAPEKDNVSTFRFLTLRDEHPDSITQSIGQIILKMLKFEDVEVRGMIGISLGRSILERFSD